MEYGCIAERLGHSFSKSIHEKIDSYDYVLQEVPKDGLDAFMKARAFRGINVTIPYKQDVIPYLDEISAQTRLLSVAVDDCFVPHGTPDELKSMLGMDGGQIAGRILAALRQKE